MSGDFDTKSDVAVELDAAHERARRAYDRRDATAYIDMFHEDLEYKQRDGRTIGRNQLASDVRVQLSRMHAATTSFHRRTLDIDGDGRAAVEVVDQHATFETRAFWLIHREWIVQRHGRFEWIRTAAGWRIRRVEVITEDIRSRIWVGWR